MKLTDPQWSINEIKQLVGGMRYMMRYGLFLGVGLLLLISVQNSQTFSDDMQTYFRQSVWQLDHELGSGSAFFITRHLLLTNRHVVDNPYVEIEGGYTIRNHSGSLTYPVKILRMSDEADLALLYCDCGGYMAMTIPFGTYPKRGEEMYGAGYGLGSHLSLGFGHAQGPGASYNGASHYSSVPTIMGDSGSPVLNKDMRVVGVRTAIETAVAQTQFGSISIGQSFHAVIIGPRVIVDFLMGRDREEPH
jgi:S1-C subfamily serine protease